jgi:hypothetical protein
MNPTELKMQPTIHLERNAGYGRGKYPALLSRCVVGCIFNSVGRIITREIPYIYRYVPCYYIFFFEAFRKYIVINYL